MCKIQKTVPSGLKMKAPTSHRFQNEGLELAKKGRFPGKNHLNENNSNRRQSIQEKGFPLSKKISIKSQSKRNFDDEISGSRRHQLSSKRNFDTISEISTKPPLRQSGRFIDETLKGKKKRDDYILKLGKKNKGKRKKELEQKFMSSMSSSLHPVLKLADNSLKKINPQFNSNSLHHNSVCIRSASKGRKKGSIKIGNKISYIIAPHGSKNFNSLNSNSRMLRTTDESRRRKLDSTLEKEDMFSQSVEVLDQDTCRRSDATTLKEGEGSCINKI
jgi:hypothetical protein